MYDRDFIPQIDVDYDYQGQEQYLNETENFVEQKQPQRTQRNYFTDDVEEDVADYLEEGYRYRLKQTNSKGANQILSAGGIASFLRGVANGTKTLTT